MEQHWHTTWGTLLSFTPYLSEGEAWIEVLEDIEQWTRDGYKSTGSMSTGGFWLDDDVHIGVDRCPGPEVCPTLAGRRRSARSSPAGD
jgi:hypothetical protein